MKSIGISKLLCLKSFHDVWGAAEENKLSLRDAAFILALKRIAKAVELQGIFP